MVRKLTETEKMLIVNYCNGDNDYCDCLNRVIEQYLSLEPDTKYMPDEILDNMVMNITDLTNYFNIDLYKSIFDRETVEEWAKEQLKESLEEDELNFYLIKSLADFETYNGTFADNWFVDCFANPRFEVLTYEILGLLLVDLIDKIKEEVKTII